MSEIILFEEVNYCYQNTTQLALNNVSFSLMEGDYTAIVGTSGSGKSTLMSIIGLINSPSSGHYYLFDTNVAQITERSKAKLKNQEIGLIFQNFNLLGHLSVFHNVCLPLTYDANTPRKLYREKALNALRQVDMEDYIDRYPNQLSGGQQQRIAIARAIVNEPSLLLADEPTGNLDSHNAQVVFSILEKLNAEGRTICLITHDENFALKAKRQLVIRDGMLVTQKQDASHVLQCS